MYSKINGCHAGVVGRAFVHVVRPSYVKHWTINKCCFSG